MANNYSSKVSRVEGVSSNRRYTANTTQSFEVNALNAITPIYTQTTMDPSEEGSKYQYSVDNLIQKLIYGSELTQQEIAFLNETDYELYKMAVKVNQERNDYKNRLYGCHSKEAVDRLYKYVEDGFINESVQIDDAYINPTEKETKLRLLRMRKAAVDNITARYKRTDTYKKLPASDDEATKIGNSSSNIGAGGYRGSFNFSV